MKNYQMAAATVILLAATVFLIDANESESDGDLTLPVVSIDTEGGKAVLSDTDYLVCSVDVAGYEDGAGDISGAEGKIRGRGNTTWYGNHTWWDMPKKPYKLKLAEETDLFGFGPTDTYIFIANYADQSLSRDYFAYTIADSIGLEHTPSCLFVDLYLNGIYQGVYMVCNRIGIESASVDIPYITEDPADSGYIVEMDGWISGEGTEETDYFVLDGNCYAIKDPDVTDPLWTAEHFSFIKGRVREAYDAVASGDVARMEGCIDVESFALTYIVNELFNTEDIAWSSFYMYYDPADGLIHSGPVWDFDTSSGNSRSEAADPECLYASYMNKWYAGLLRTDGFAEMVGDLLSLNRQTIADTMDADMEYLRSHRYDFEHNFDRWGVLGSTIWANPVEFVHLRTWESHADYLYGWLTASLDHVCSVYCG
ncbi:CotH kinase family protein [Methanomethylophilus alvi]|uniref:CotH kinase family protein n=1 Tax=Methanomethylophilus alvi TaxID=1291540 RepID=UPI0037DD3432